MSATPAGAGPSLLPRYHAVYLSPHLDDAVLSCGGQIHRRTAAGEAVLVATVGTRDEPPAPWPKLVAELHRAWGLASGVVAARRREDAAACSMLGADWLHLGLAEAIYRCAPGDTRPLYPTLLSLFAGVAASDASFAQEIADALQRQLPAHDEILAPLGAGGHADHRLTRTGAELFASSDVTLYEEFPYAARWWGRRGCRRLAGPGRAARVVPLEPSDLEARGQAILAYASQVAPLFRSPARLRRRLEREVRRVGGERVWKAV